MNISTDQYLTREAFAQIKDLTKDIQERFEQIAAFSGLGDIPSPFAFADEVVCTEYPAVGSAEIVPFSRIKLLQMHWHPQTGLGISAQWALVVDHCSDTIGAYICRPTTTPHGRIQVSISYVFDCLEPLGPGQLDPLQPPDEWQDILY